MEVPVEILSAIVALLKDNYNFAAIRLVNKAFAAVAAPYLFKTIHIPPVLKVADNARSIYENFGAYIRTIIISGAIRTSNPLDSHSRGFNWMNHWMRKELVRDGHQPLSNLHLRHLAAVHTLICQDRKIALTPRGLEKFLRQVCKYAPRIENVRFPRMFRDKRERGGHLAPVRLYEQCADPRCLRAQEKVYDITYMECSEPDIGDMKARIISVIQTMSRAGLAIKELEFWGYHQSLRLPTGRIGTFGTLPYLSTLYLTVDVECDGKNRISAWLAASTQIEKLYIKIHNQPLYQDRSTTTLNEVFATCRFPKLRHLLLQAFDSNSQELLSFLQACGQLEQLVLFDYNLHNYNLHINTVKSWHRALIEIRNTTHLRPITNLEDTTLLLNDTERDNPDGWVMELWDNSTVDKPNFLSTSLSETAYRTMEKIYLWGGQESAKRGSLDDNLFWEYRQYIGDFWR